MDDLNPRAVIGANQPPEPIDPMEAIQAAYDGVFMEVGNWADGAPVTSEAQMRAVDRLLESVKEAEKEAKAAKEEEYRPHKAAGDAVIARWKVFLDDLTRQRQCLASASEGFKQRLRAEQEAAERAARAEAARKTREAEEAAAKAQAADLDAQRAAAAAQQEAHEAQRRAVEAGRGKVKGLRTHTEYVVAERREFARWQWVNDQDAYFAFQDERARQLKLVIPGVVEAVTERRAV